MNPYDPQVRANPYEYYHQQRARDPIERDQLGIWYVSRYADAEFVLRDKRFGRNFDQFLQAQIGDGPLRSMLNGMLLYKDPPDHTRLRSLVAKAFSARVVTSIRPSIQNIVDDLVDARLLTHQMDIIDDLAYPLPVLVICRLLGIPQCDTPLFRGWSRDLSAALDYVLAPDVVSRAQSAARESTEYLTSLVAQRRRTPGLDLLTRLIEAEEQGHQLTEHEIISTCMFLFGAGHETTTGLIGNGMLALLKHPGELSALRMKPTLIGCAVEEVLRYDSPVQMAGRVAVEDVVIGNKCISAGDVVVVLLGAANHDPERFTDPDRLDIARRDNAALSFGGGIHYCLGAALARVEAETALLTLARRLTAIELDTTALQWRNTVVLRSLERLPVTFRPYQ